MIGSDIAPMAGVTNRRVTLGVDDGDERLRHSDPYLRRRNRRRGRVETRNATVAALIARYGDGSDD